LYFSFPFSNFYLFGSKAFDFSFAPLRWYFYFTGGAGHFDDNTFWFFFGSAWAGFDFNSTLRFFGFFFFLFLDNESDFAFPRRYGYFVLHASYSCFAFFECWFVLEIFLSALQFASSFSYSTFEWNGCFAVVFEYLLSFAFELEWASPFGESALPFFCERGRREERQRCADGACEYE